MWLPGGASIFILFNQFFKLFKSFTIAPGLELADNKYNLIVEKILTVSLKITGSLLTKLSKKRGIILRLLCSVFKIFLHNLFHFTENLGGFFWLWIFATQTGTGGIFVE